MSKPTSVENLFIFGNQNNTTTTSVWKFSQTVPNPFVKTNSLNFNQSNANAKQIFTPRSSRMNVIPSVNVGDNAKKGEINKKYFSRMNNFFKESKYCDIDIVIGNKTFNCHRMVLASASSYFDKMFSGAFVESTQKTITLDAVGADCFENILEFVYSKQLRISEKNAYELLTASRYFDIEDMEDFCVKFMTSNIPKGQIFEVCSFAHLTDKKELYEAALKYIAENFITLSKREEFSTMSFEILQDVVKHKSLERLDDLILDLIIRWKNSKSGSIDQAKSLLKNVNTGGVTSDFLAKVVMNDDKMSCFSIRTVGIEDLKYMVDEYTYRDIDRTWIQNSNYHKEKCFEKNIIIQERIFTLSCSNSIVPVNEFHMLNLNEEKQPLKVPPISVSRYTLSAINNTIYLHMTDIIPQNIVEVSSLPKAKDMENSKSMFAYVYDLDEWFVIPKPKFEVINSCITTLNNLLYLVGGSHLMDVSVNGYAQCYDPRMPTWIPLPSMSYSHCSGAACPFNGKLYVLGGTKCKCLEVFDPVAGRWEELKAPFYDHLLFSFVSYKNCLWALGNGRNYDNNCREILPECYHTNENIWTKEAELKAQNPLAGVVDAIVM